MIRGKLFLMAIILSTVYQSSFGAPYQHTLTGNELPQDSATMKHQNLKRFSHRSESKKDIFISRGWGAGGMPFSVLYMNPTFSSPKAQGTVETINIRQHPPAPVNKPQQQQQQQQQPPHKSFPQVRNSMRQKGLNRTPHSVIPQLFVSYGWGPLGKK